MRIRSFIHLGETFDINNSFFQNTFLKHKENLYGFSPKEMDQEEHTNLVICMIVQRCLSNVTKIFIDRSAV